MSKKGATAWDRYKHSRQAERGESVGLTGRALEQAIMGIGLSHPEYVVIEGAPSDG